MQLSFAILCHQNTHQPWNVLQTFRAQPEDDLAWRWLYFRAPKLDCFCNSLADLDRIWRICIFSLMNFEPTKKTLQSLLFDVVVDDLCQHTTKCSKMQILIRNTSDRSVIDVELGSNLTGAGVLACLTFLRTDQFFDFRDVCFRDFCRPQPALHSVANPVRSTQIFFTVLSVRRPALVWVCIHNCFCAQTLFVQCLNSHFVR